MASTDDHLRDIKRLLLGIQGTIVGYVVVYAGGAGNTDIAEIILGLGVIIFLISLIATIMVYIT